MATGKLKGKKNKFQNIFTVGQLGAGSSSDKNDRGRAAQAAVSALLKKYPGTVDISRAQAILRRGVSPNSDLGRVIANAGYHRNTIRKTPPAPLEVQEQTASKTPPPVKPPAPAKVKSVVDSDGLPVDVEAVIEELIRCGKLRSEDAAQPAGHETAGGSGTGPEGDEEEGEERGQRKVGAALWNRIVSRDSYTCRFCFHVFSELEDKNRYKGGPARSAAKQGPARRLTMDHDVPWCAGGPTTFENVFCACEPCNQSKDLFWWDDLVPLNRAPPTTTFPFIRPTIPKHHWLTMNRRVRHAVKKLKARGIFEKVAGGEHPMNFKAVRAAMESVDPVVSNSPLKGASKKRKIVYESDSEGECEEAQPPCKSRRTH